MAAGLTQREVFPSLTGLRFVLAVWISSFHLISLYGPAWLAEHPLIEVGNARVDVFFVLSGFVLAHIYALRTGGQFDFAKFMRARLARLYPLHVAAIALLAAAVAAAHLTGRGADADAYTLQGLIGALLFLQAWNVPGAQQWNFPAWTLSAEFAAYLCFPVFVAAAVWLKGRAWVFLAACLALVAGLDLLWPSFGHGALSEATSAFGVVRGAAGVLVGVAARYVMEKVSLSPMSGWALAGAGAVIAGMAAVADAPLWAIHVGACALLAGLAGLDRAGAATPLAASPMQWLGRCSYALFVLHVPVFVLGVRALAMTGWGGELGLLSGAALMAAAFAAGVAANRLLEEPARAWILQPKAPVSARIKSL